MFTEGHIPRILVVEDEALLAMDFVEIFEGAGFEPVGPATNVASALALIAEQNIDIATLDVNLGTETSEAIALELIAREIPFVMLTAYADLPNTMAKMKAPMILKPARASALLATLRNTLSQGVEKNRPSLRGVPAHKST